MDTNLNIRTTVETASVTSLRGSLKDLRTEWNGLNADGRNAPAGKELANQINQVNVAIKQANPNIDTMIQKTRAARAEHRLMSFGMLSLIGTMGAFGGKSQQLAQSLQSIVGAGMGVNYAMSLMGGTMSKLAGPAGIVVALAAAFYQVKEAIDSTELSAADIQKKFNEMNKTQEGYNASTGGAATSKIIATTPEGSSRNAKLLGEYKSQLQDATAIYEKYLQTNREYTKEGLEAEKNYYDALKKVNDQQKLNLEYDIRIKNERVDQAIATRNTIQSIMNPQSAFAPSNRRMAALQGMRRNYGLTQSQQNIESDLLTGNNVLDPTRSRRERILGANAGDAASELKTMQKVTDDIRQGFDRIGNSIESNLIQKLHLANNLAGQMTQELLQTALSLAGTIASGGASSGIDGIFQALGLLKGKSSK